MSFIIKLQRNDSELNRLDKSIVDILTMTGELRDSTSIINPKILINATMEQVRGCNYLTIPSFNRSYFVNNINSFRTGVVELTCHVDVLSSFSAQIKANSAIISKAQDVYYNKYLNDGTFHVYQPTITVTKEFPVGFTDQKFIVAIAGSEIASGGSDPENPFVPI